MHRLSLLPSASFYPTASELRIAGECVSPWALGLPEESETNEWAEQGKRMHKSAEILAHGVLALDGFARAVDCLVDSRETAMLRAVHDVLRVDFEHAMGGRPWHVEQGIKWSSDGFDDEAEFCERAPGERLRGWFAGTADLAYVRRDNLLVVADWKFGPREKVNGEPAKESCQGFFLATAFAAKLGIRGSGPGVVVARFERRIVSENGIEVDGYDITQGDIDAFAEQLRGLARRIDKVEGAMPKISAACGKCKAKAACPAWDALEGHTVAAMVDVNSSQVNALYGPPQNAEDVRVLHHAIEQGEHLTAEWKRWLDAYVLTSGPVSIGLGLSLKATPQSKRAVVATPEAMDAIERVAGKSAIVVERSATCESIKKAAREGVGEGITSTADRNKAKAKAEAEAFAALIELGAVRETGKSYVVREVRTGEEE